MVSYLFDLAGKNMGSTTESHLLCQLFFRATIFSWERISAARITDRSVRAGSYLDMKDGKMEEGRCKSEGEERRRERGRAPLGIIIPEIHWPRIWVGGRGLLNLAHHHFISRYFTCPPFFLQAGMQAHLGCVPSVSPQIEQIRRLYCLSECHDSCNSLPGDFVISLIAFFSIRPRPSCALLPFDSISGSCQVSRSVIAVLLQVGRS